MNTPPGQQEVSASISTVTSVDIDYDALLGRAKRLADPTLEIVSELRPLVASSVRDFPAPGTTSVSTCGCVDGAVASEQTDALTWTVAVGVRQYPGIPDELVHAATVTPVGAETERVRGALMASCEVAAALSTPDGHVTFMDGGLSTPLVSIAQGLAVTAPEAASAIHEHFTRISLDDVVGGYVDAVLAGKIAALPKQDTSSGYANLWATQHLSELGEPAAAVLAGARDRPVLSALLQPGQWITPRPATELARIEAKMTTRDGVKPAKVDRHYARIREQHDLFVTYFKPTRLPDRVIKVEFHTSDTRAWKHAEQLVSMLDAQTIGPRIKEPIMQHQVDSTAKQRVASQLTQVMGAATAELTASSTQHYRTVR